MGLRLQDQGIEKIADGLNYCSHGLRIQAKSADYTVVASDIGSWFTTRGATGAIIFTLPAVTSAFTGFVCWFFNAVGQNMTINSTANEMMTFNDLDADGVVFSTGSELIGATIMAVCDGTSWLVSPMTEETQTMTVTT